MGADAALERVGLDPLAQRYQSLGASKHRMRYVAAPSERIPFGDGHFDMVSSFNSLDHVADVARTIDEIVRVLKRGGLFLLITEVNHDPTPTEPQTFDWDILERFQPALELLEIDEYEKSADLRVPEHRSRQPVRPRPDRSAPRCAEGDVSQTVATSSGNRHRLSRLSAGS